MTGRIKYVDGFKYRLVEPYEISLPIYGHSIDADYLDLNAAGRLLIRAGYAWDGPSGPTVDRRNTLRASLVHDALYQLLRLGVIDPHYKRTADDMFRQLLLEDGMNSVRAWAYWKAVSLFGGAATRPSAERQPKLAP